MNDSPLWKPKHPEKTNMWHFLQFINNAYQCQLKNYNELHQWSINNLADFWQSLSDFFNIKFPIEADTIYKSGQHMIESEWFSGAQLNFSQQLLSSGNDNKTAIIAVNEEGQRQSLSYKELKQEVASVSTALKKLDVHPGDRVAAVMPNTIETVIAMLAATSLGAIWASCSPDFGSQAIIDRLGQISPKVLFICDGHQYQGKKHPGIDKINAISTSVNSLKKIVLVPNINEDIEKLSTTNLTVWNDFKEATGELNFQHLPFNHPLYILFSSGTTGKPKCIIHGAGGTLLQHMKELALHTNISEKDNLCFYTTCGWMMWNWMISVLSLGATLTLYEGSPTYPSSGRMFELIENEKITVFGTSAKFISAIEKREVKPNESNDLRHLKTLLSTGSPLLPKNYDYVYQYINEDIQLSSISGGTDIISCFALGNPMLPVYRGELQSPGLGMAVEIYNDKGESVKEERGELVCTKPFPSMPIGFWDDPDNSKYLNAYFKRFNNVWAHGDYAEITKHLGLIIHGRSDAILNPGGVRIGTAEIYRQVEKIPEVVDSVVIGQDWQDDVRVVLFVKLKPGIELDDELVYRIKKTIKSNASPRHVPAKILQVGDIPKTINGKVVELAVRKIIHGEAINNIESLANPNSLKEFENKKELLT